MESLYQGASKGRKPKNKVVYKLKKTARLAELRGSLRELMDSVKGGHSVRPDGTILHPASQETVWFDTAGTHTTCKSHLVTEHKHALSRRAAGRDGARMASARLLEEHRIKLDRYALLAAIAQRQLLDGLRPVAPSHTCVQGQSRKMPAGFACASHRYGSVPSHTFQHEYTIS